MKITKKVLLCIIMLLTLTMAAPAQVEAAPKISKKTVTLIKGQKATLKITGTKSKVKWSSSKKSVASVSSKGRVTAKKKGKATITAKVGKKKLTCKVTVQTPKLSKTKLSMNVGGTETIKLSGTDKKVTWKSSNKSIATVNSKGRITAKKAGTVKITATVLKKKYTCTVTVKEVSLSEKVLLPMDKVVYSDNGIVIKTTEISESSKYIKIGFYVENSSSLNLGLNAHSFAVNGIMSEESIYYMDYDVPAGKKANMTLDIDKTWLEDVGIKKIQQLNMVIWAYDNAVSYYAFDTGVILIGNGYRQYLSGKTVYDKDGVYVKQAKNKDGRYYFIVGNSGSRYFDFDVENMSINDFGYSKYIYWGNEQVLTSCERLVSFEIDSEFLSLNKISTVDKIEFSLENTYERDYFNSVMTDAIVLDY